MLESASCLPVLRGGAHHRPALSWHKCGYSGHSPWPSSSPVPAHRGREGDWSAPPSSLHSALRQKQSELCPCTQQPAQACPHTLCSRTHTHIQPRLRDLSHDPPSLPRVGGAQVWGNLLLSLRRPWQSGHACCGSTCSPLSPSTINTRGVPQIPRNISRRFWVSQQNSASCPFASLPRSSRETKPTADPYTPPHRWHPASSLSKPPAQSYKIRQSLSHLPQNSYKRSAN